MSPTPLADVGDAGAVLDLRSNFVEDVLDVGVGSLGTAGHEGGAVARAVFAAGDPHAEVEEAFFGDVVDAAFGVLIPLVAAVDDAVAGLEVVGESGDGLVDGGAGLDEDDDGSGALDGEDEVTRGVLAREREGALVAGPIYGLVDFGGRTVVDGDWEALLRYV
ncbi:hypothetical protein V8G54_001376 [Vigna mungo]|uniref:Uncharacterized protein n=1 Tax=Vigna mungo TaxID=3915 RepID=A0AAQ3S9V8_VIGMU